ncbi:FAD-binding protein [Corallococcus sp. M7]
MPCTGDGSVGTLIRFPLLSNWARTRAFIPPNLIRPTSVTQLAAAVRAVETGGGVLRAMGSHWSYTEVALTRDVTHVVDTSALANLLNGTDATSPAATLLPFALNDDARANAGNLIHVEAGIKIHALNCALDALGKAMPTLGGSNGQSLAGVMGTGTHGSDVDFASISDQVRAVHLVVPGDRSGGSSRPREPSRTSRAWRAHGMRDGCAATSASSTTRSCSMPCWSRPGAWG